MKTFVVLARNFRNEGEIEFDWFDLSFSDRRRLLIARVDFHLLTNAMYKSRKDSKSS